MINFSLFLSSDKGKSSFEELKVDECLILQVVFERENRFPLLYHQGNTPFYRRPIPESIPSITMQGSPFIMNNGLTCTVVTSREMPQNAMSSVSSFLQSSSIDRYERPQKIVVR